LYYVKFNQTASFRFQLSEVKEMIAYSSSEIHSRCPFQMHACWGWWSQTDVPEVAKISFGNEGTHLWLI